MAHVIKACFQNVTNFKGICICCTSQNGYLVNVLTCTHTTFLENFIKLKLDPNKMHICIHCHHILKKIELFQRQVEETIELLTDQGQVLKINKLHDLQHTSVVIVDTTQHNRSTDDTKAAPVKVLPDASVAKVVLDTDIKIEHDSASDCDNEIPLADIKSKGRTEVVRYEGKISTMTLTVQELEMEREKLRNSEGYLKLPFRCEDCILGFDHEGTLIRHMDSRHKQTNTHLMCNICKSVLGSESSFKEHKRRHFKRHQCLQCGRLFNHLRSAVQHYDDAHAPPDDSIQEMYTCKLCRFDTKSHRVYRHHMDKHKQRPECKICGNAFVNTNGLRVHMQNVHGKSAHRYKCNKCDKSYNAKSGLFTHTRTAHAHAPLAYCQLCNTRYKSEQALRHHIKTHSSHITENDKKFICDYCETRFVRKHSLRVHIAWAHLHTDKHRCETCSKLFISAGMLKQHISFVHEKKRPPKDKICDYCGRGFTTQAILKAHIRTHTGEKPYSCGHCGARFAHSGALHTHNKLLHGGQRH